MYYVQQMLPVTTNLATVASPVDSNRQCMDLRGLVRRPLHGVGKIIDRFRLAHQLPEQDHVVWALRSRSFVIQQTLAEGNVAMYAMVPAG